MFLAIPVCIGFPIETEPVTARASTHSTTLKSHNFLMRKYFVGWSKIKIPLTDVVSLKRKVLVVSLVFVNKNDQSELSIWSEMNFLVSRTLCEAFGDW